ncbi:protein FLOURY ENDOSPERM 6, chloroplastic-like isoform X2 [Panicum virgatum]|uniref:protein FLOURY ENDOSPERM 6, chloroplastic-like isoform X2 n=1 Tax=Panicum virgatum TaxID=38727 RepID=UPI0019D52E99|nr:protein FLOURY ENDOSPERM 6, chloroplastic-like isoform X2 [Panicum virgatum]
MRPFLPSLLLPIPPLTLPPSPPHFHRRRFPPAPLAASYRRPYRRRHRDAPRQQKPRAPPPPPPSRQQQQQRAANGAAPGARRQEELEEAIYDFMCRSAKPGAFPTCEELFAAGRADLAAAVASSGGWLSLGWSSAGGAPRSSAGGHPNYPPDTGAYHHDDLAPASADDSEWEEVSPSGRQPEMEETKEVTFKTGIEGMLTRLQRDRERARPPPRSSARDEGPSDNVALARSSSTPSSSVAGDSHKPSTPENESVHGSQSQNGMLDGNSTLPNSSNDAWKTWTLRKGALSDFEAAEVLPTGSGRLSQYDELDTALVQNDFHRSSNGVAASDYPSDGVDSERDEIHYRLQSLELDLSAALKTLRSRFDKVLSNMSNDNGATVVGDISDDWEFEETKVMQAQEELRSIRAKIAVLEGKMALEIIERNKIIEDKQRRLDEVEKALSELRTVCIMWANPASEVLLVGSFDGWTSQRKLERTSERGMFTLNLKLYPD